MNTFQRKVLAYEKDKKVLLKKHGLEEKYVVRVKRKPLPLLVRFCFWVLTKNGGQIVPMYKNAVETKQKRA